MQIASCSDERVHLLELRSERLRILSSCTAGHRVHSVRTFRRVIAGAYMHSTNGGLDRNCRAMLLNYRPFDRTGEKCWVQTMVAWTRVQEDETQGDEAGQGSPSPWQRPGGTLDIFGWRLPPAVPCRAPPHEGWSRNHPYCSIDQLFVRALDRHSLLRCYRLECRKACAGQNTVDTYNRMRGMSYIALRRRSDCTEV
jgi:hypothetical protein